MENRLYDDGADEDIVYTLCEMANVARRMNDMELAETLCKDSLAMNERLGGEEENKFTSADVFLAKAEVALAKEEYETVEKLGRRSLALREQIHGTDAKHPEIAVAIHVLAAGKFKQGELGAAVELVKRSLEMYRSVYCCYPAHPYLIRVERDSELWQAEWQRLNV